MTTKNPIPNYEYMSLIEDFYDKLFALQTKRGLSDKDMVDSVNDALGSDTAWGYEEWLSEGEN